jgi:hypothetical protein
VKGAAAEMKLISMVLMVPLLTLRMTTVKHMEETPMRCAIGLVATTQAVRTVSILTLQAT